VYRWGLGAVLALGASVSCSGSSTLGPPEGSGNTGAASPVAGRSGAAAGGAAGRGPGGRAGRPAGEVGGGAGEAAAGGDNGVAGDTGVAGDGSGAVGGNPTAGGGSGGLTHGGQGGELSGGCGYLHLQEGQVCTTASDRYTHVPEAADVAACEAACTDASDCAGIAWAAPEARCEILNEICAGLGESLPGKPRVYGKVCDEQGVCDLVESDQEACGGTPWLVPDATDFAACEAACLEQPYCGALLTYFELTEPPGCYLVRSCGRLSERGGLAQQSYERVCDLIAEEQLRPPPRLALGRQHSCLRLTDGSARCWGANAHVTYDFDGSYVVSDTLGLAGGPFTRLAANEWDTCGIGLDHDVTCSTEHGPDLLVDVADLDGSNNGAFLGLRLDGRFDRDDRDTWVRAAQGGRASCLLAADGHVDCNGYVSSDDERMQDPSGQFVRIAVGNEFACGVRVDGTLECWGNDAFGQASPPAGKFSNVTAGNTHACGLKTNGTIACWGKNTLGQATPPAGQFAEVVAAFDHTCALLSGSSEQVRCWGNDDGFQSSPPMELRSDVAPVVQWVAAGGVGFSGTYYTEDTGEDDPATYYGPGPLPVHACGLDQNDTIHCFGSAGDPPSGSGFHQLAAGVGSTCALSSSGIECWGEPYDPDWGPTTESPLNGSVRPGAFTSVSTGWDLACAIREEDASLECWGPEGSGPLAPSGQFSDVAAGGAHRRWSRHACGVRFDATVTCWSYDDSSGELVTPYDVAGTFKAVAVGYTIDCAIDGNGGLHCWDGALGPSPDPENDFPVPAGDFTLVVAGDGQACALRTNGAITCFTVPDSPGAVVLDGEYPGPFFGLTMGGDYACGLLADGTPRCWGSYVQ